MQGNSVPQRTVRTRARQSLAAVAFALVLLGLMAPSASAQEYFDVTKFEWMGENGDSVSFAYDAGESSGVTGLEAELFIDNASVDEWSCQCDLVGWRSYSIPPVEHPETPVLFYDFGTLVDGSTHTARIEVTELPSGTKSTETWTFTMDKVAPDLTAIEGPVSQDGTYIAPPPPEGHPLEVDGWDEGSGMSRISLEKIPFGGAGWLTWKDCGGVFGGIPVQCSGDALEADFTLDADDLTPGETRWRVEANDRAGHDATAEWKIYVDAAGPAAVTGVGAYSDPSNDTAYVQWSEAADPALPGGAPGSGTTRYSYRYRIGTGAWTALAETVKPYFAIPTTPPGTSVQVEITAIDAVGNHGTVAGAIVTVVAAEYGARLCQVPRAECLAELEAEENAAARGPVKVVDVVVCHLARPLDQNGQDSVQPDLKDHPNGEPDIVIGGRLSAWCEPREEGNLSHEYYAARTTVQFTDLCVSYYYNTQTANDAQTLKCEGSAPSGKGPTESSPFTGPSVDELCKPGNATKYSMTGDITVRIDVSNAIPHEDSINPRWFTHPCNEAGAWRRVATRGPGRASAILAKNLLDTGSQFDPLPDGNGKGLTHGFEAHHIVPGGENKYELNSGDDDARSQGFAYTCGMTPNGAGNGVWLRGYELDVDDDDWEDLSLPDKTRVSHRTKPDGIHISGHEGRYYEEVADRLRDLVDTNQMLCSATGTEIRTTIDGLRNDLVEGFIPGVGQVSP